MAQDFDEFPLDDMVLNQDGRFSGVWRAAISAFFQNLTGYLTQYGMLVPRVTTEERDSIQAPEEGQQVYVTDAIPGPPRTAQLQIWQVKLDVGAWRVVTTV